MDAIKVNFRVSTDTVDVVDALAKADHRDRTSMLNRILDFYLNHPDNKAVIAQAKANATEWEETTTERGEATTGARTRGIAIERFGLICPNEQSARRETSTIAS